MARGKQGDYGGERGDQDGSYPGQTCHDQGLLIPPSFQYIGIIEQDDAVIDHNTDQDDESGKGIGSSVKNCRSGSGQSMNRLPPADLEHQHHRFGKGFKYRSQDHVYEDKCCKYQELEITQVLLIMYHLSPQRRNFNWPGGFPLPGGAVWRSLSVVTSFKKEYSTSSCFCWFTLLMSYPLLKLKLLICWNGQHSFHVLGNSFRLFRFLSF